MKFVVKIFIKLNEILLFIFAVLIPLIFLTFLIIAPTRLGVNLVDEFGLEMFGLGILILIIYFAIYELAVIMAFGVLAIMIENYKNLQSIADLVEFRYGISNSSKPPVGNAQNFKVEPSLGLSSKKKEIESVHNSENQT